MNVSYDLEVNVLILKKSLENSYGIQNLGIFLGTFKFNSCNKSGSETSLLRRYTKKQDHRS